MTISRRQWLRMMAVGGAGAALSGCAGCFRDAETENMAVNEDAVELAKTVAYCGLVCGVCRRAAEGLCKGCRNEGGSEKCYQRKCCAEHRLDGCWQCEEFPCDNGYFAESNEMWRGLYVASVECIQDHGTEDYVGRVVAGMGTDVDYHEYEFKEIEEIRATLGG